ncbi:TRAP transporter substrate-binding protein DctP [Thalassovita aquimarina]|uniref:TRAP transporter substrate-binding protein DctP n=1 Tax=Thalassovita aquimarina TaxID=2785917 RepID=A0ABS5HQT9_9RHOB|nr:TRAP transporter substrate-binding protein DctP [Thalassovita aquimarina]MBR9651330.1 TRAP transporter substrate-binding protein DctP [Thalassovita aquimarina]
MTYRFSALLPAAALALAGSVQGASAEEAVLRAISAFQASTVFYDPFQLFVDRVNANGEGLVKIEVIGGPDAMPPFEIGNALRSGIVDLANTTAVYHANLVPEGLAMTLTNRPMSELRENGGYALLDQIHKDKAKLHWLGRLSENIQYHIYLSDYPENLDFGGLKVRSAPTYQAFFNGLGITPVQTAPGEVFTALERNTIDGYAWPSIGLFDLGWQEKTAARIEPGFFQVETGVYFSDKSWQALSEEQQDFLTEQMLELEAENGRFTELAKTDFARQEEEGIRAYELPAEEAAEFTAMSLEQGWKPVLAASPENGAKLRDLFVK